MERTGRQLVKISPRDHPTLRECMIASFKANGPMSNGELYRSLPHFGKNHIKRLVVTLSDELTGRG